MSIDLHKMGSEAALEEELDLEGWVEGVFEEQVEVVVVVHLEVKLGGLSILPDPHCVLFELERVCCCAQGEGVEDEVAGLKTSSE